MCINKLLNIKILLLVTLFFWISSALAQQAICYDVTNTSHRCPQKKPQDLEENANYNTENTKKAGLRRITISALTQECPQKDTQTAQNTLDILKVIETVELEDNEKFVCKMFVEIQKQNAKIEEERRFMLEYIYNKKAGKPPTTEDHIQMTALFIKYRLMENKNEFCSPYETGNTCYFAGTRFSAPQEMQQKIHRSAKNYVRQFKDGPNGCMIDGARQNNLSLCLEEIKSRVAPIPAPLILAQITQESGWGKSRWAENYNNFLGLQHKFKNPQTMACYKNCRCAGEHKNRCAMNFKNITGCLYEYYGRFNASSLPEYQEFRKVRDSLPSSKNNITTQCHKARALIPQLKVYAEDEGYLDHICHSVNKQICNIMSKCPPFKITPS